MTVFLAELNKENICIGIKQAKEFIDGGKHVEIESLSNDYLWRKYENGRWSDEKYPPPEQPKQETTEEKLTRLEQKIQDTTLIQYDALATIFEEILLLQDKLNGGGTND